jgi:CheY-like chemotaxis protein
VVGARFVSGPSAGPVSGSGKGDGEGSPPAKDAPTSALVVDDSVPVLKMTSRALESIGCQVDTAKNGEVALEKMKVALYDLVLMDVQMPVKNGMAASKELREYEHKNSRRRQFIVGVSANSEGVMKRMCLESGMDNFAIKPFTLDDVISMYRQHQLSLPD